MLEKVPGAMDRQHEVMTMFKQQLESGMENNRRLTDSMGNLNHTLSAMDESQRASTRTVTDLIHRSRESEQLLREVMRRSERRMTALVIFFFLAVVALGFYFLRGWERIRPGPARATAGISSAAEPAPDMAPAAPAAPDVPEVPAAEPAEFRAPPADEKAETGPAEPPAKTARKNRSKAKSRPAPAPEPPAPANDPAPPEPVGEPDLTLEQIQQAVGADIPEAEPANLPVSLP
jgi:hypothetical protein